jgi:peptidoglycan/xylan/chitin deacetylase (PgdA/CDA1 family)
MAGTDYLRPPAHRRGDHTIRGRIMHGSTEIVPLSLAIGSPSEGPDPLANWWSLAGSWLTKHGIPSGGPSAVGFPLLLGGALRGERGYIEGPCPSHDLALLGVRIDERIADRVELLPADGPSLGEVGFATDIVRRIPAARGERSEPFQWTTASALMAVPPLRVRFLRLGEGWECLAEGRLADGSAAGCVLARRGGLTVAGAPFLAMAVRNQWMPPVEVGYYSTERTAFGEAAEVWLAETIRCSARAAGFRLPVRSPWPGSARSALTVRFDHDRPIPEESLADLLALLDSHGLKASWGFLARLSDPATMRAVARRGHEIVLHTEAGSRERLREELDHFRALGHDVRGVTAHGGIGSAGHLGQRLYEWAAAEGLEHADILFRETLLPHPAIAAGPCGLRELPLMLPPVHCSLDFGTKPDAHALPALLRELPARLARGGLVTVMNHPDIHREQLRQLFTALDLGTTWCTTHLGAVRRMRAAASAAQASPAA